MKYCKTCKQTKSYTEFRQYVPEKKTGKKYYRHLCNDCHLAYNREYRKKPEVKQMQSKSSMKHQNKMKNDESFILKRRAKEIVRNAILHRGLKKDVCKVCGEENSHGHHEDYHKPLEVTWLCRKHHTEYHQVMKG